MEQAEPFDRGRAAARAIALAQEALVVALGYCAAVLVATIVTVAHMVLPSVLPDDGAMGSFFGALRDWPGLLLGGFSVAFPTALPGFLVFVALAAWRGWRDAPPFAAAGGLNAFAALWFFDTWSGGAPPVASVFFMFCCFGGGLAGGFAYWLAAASWRQPTMQVRLNGRGAACSRPRDLTA